jgi:hypothetical protein
MGFCPTECTSGSLTAVCRASLGYPESPKSLYALNTIIKYSTCINVLLKTVVLSAT